MRSRRGAGAFDAVGDGEAAAMVLRSATVVVIRHGRIAAFLGLSREIGVSSAAATAQPEDADEGEDRC